MSWQLNADKLNVPGRERFATRLSVLCIFCAFVFLLVLLYPEKGLLSVIREGNDAATVRYREPLLRIRPDDTDLRLKVVDSLVHTGNARRALDVLYGLPSKLTKAQSEILKDLRYVVLKSLLAEVAPQSAEWHRLKPQVASAAKHLGGPSPPAWRLSQFAKDARDAGDMDAWRDYDQRAEKKRVLENAIVEVPLPKDDLEMAELAGDYRKAANICFQRMQISESLDGQRELFIKAVRLLQAGNLLKEAFVEGERHLGKLKDDRETLIFLNRVGLSAGQLSGAQRLIKRVLRMDVDPLQRGV
jgi:hypothetical protein